MSSQRKRDQPEGYPSDAKRRKYTEEEQHSEVESKTASDAQNPLISGGDVVSASDVPSERESSMSTAGFDRAWGEVFGNQESAPGPSGAATRDSSESVDTLMREWEASFDEPGAGQGLPASPIHYDSADEDDGWGNYLEEAVDKFLAQEGNEQATEAAESAPTELHDDEHELARAEELLKWDIVKSKAKGKGKAPLKQQQSPTNTSKAPSRTLPRAAIAPILHEENVESFASRTTFECDECPPDEKYADLGVNDFEYSEERAGDPRIGVEGQLKRRKLKFSGFHMQEILDARVCAADKFAKWLTATYPGDGVARRAARDITLVEHEPDGRQGEPARWADKLKEIGRIVHRAKGTIITLRIKISNTPPNVQGYTKDWHAAIIRLLEHHPSCFRIDIMDDSILTAIPTHWYPVDTVQRDADAMDYYNEEHHKQLSSMTGVVIDDEADFMTAVEHFKEIRNRSLSDKKKRLRESIARCCNFVDDLRFFQRNGHLPQLLTDTTGPRRGRQELTPFRNPNQNWLA